MKKYSLQELIQMADRNLDPYSTEIVSESASLAYSNRIDRHLERAEKVRDAGDPGTAFSYSLRVFRDAGIRDVDDGYGAVYDAVREFPVFWKSILELADEKLQERMLSELIDSADGAIIDFQEDLLLDFLFSEFTKASFADPLLAFAEKRRAEAIVEGSQTEENWNRWIAPLRFLRGDSPRKIVGELACGSHDPSYEETMKIIDQADDPLLSWCALTRFAKWIKSPETKDTVHREQLQRLEETVPQRYRDFEAFCSSTPDDIAKYDIWRAAFPEDLWPILVCRWFAAAGSIQKSLAEKSGNGHFYAKLLRGHSYFGGGDMQEADRAAKVLRKTDPLFLFGLYCDAFKREAGNAHTRSQYAAVAEKLASLQDIPEADIALPIILKEIRGSYVGRPAFTEELEKRFPELP